MKAQLVHLCHALVLLSFQPAKVDRCHGNTATVQKTQLDGGMMEEAELSLLISYEMS
jgi:hypothetical protein